jgi:predicted flap endonuclease-1-like 5' DNA nuclease
MEIWIIPVFVLVLIAVLVYMFREQLFEGEIAPVEEENLVEEEAIETERGEDEETKTYEAEAKEFFEEKPEGEEELLIVEPEEAIEEEEETERIEPETLPEGLVNLLDEGDAQKLVNSGVDSLEDLFSRLDTDESVAALSDETDIPQGTLDGIRILRELGRIDGIGPKYQELLEAAGINNIYSLAGEDSEALTARLEKVNETEGIVSRPPPNSTVDSWVEQAKNMRKTL